MDDLWWITYSKCSYLIICLSGIKALSIVLVQAAQLATTNNSCESVVTSSQQQTTSQCPPKDASPVGFVSIVEESLTEFLSKATGTAVEWIQMPGMKRCPDSIGSISISHGCPISHGCTGVAARACSLVSFEPTRVAEILKDQLSWYRDCRAVDVMNVMSTGNGGIIELLYMQLYALITLAPARDFWLMRYTSLLEDGSVVVRNLKPYEESINILIVLWVFLELLILHLWSFSYFVCVRSVRDHSATMADVSSPKCTLDLTSALEVGTAGSKALGDNGGSGSGKSVMTIAFQFAFEMHLQESVAAMARQYVRSIISSVQSIASALSPSRLGSLNSSPLSPGTPEAETLARWIIQSYSFFV